MKKVETVDICLLNDILNKLFQILVVLFYSTILKLNLLKYFRIILLFLLYNFGVKNYIISTVEY